MQQDCLYVWERVQQGALDRIGDPVSAEHIEFAGDPDAGIALDAVARPDSSETVVCTSLRRENHMTHVLMMASYGLEIVECGGAVVRAIAAGDTVTAAVLMCREDSKQQVQRAAAVLGVDQVDFLDVPFGEVSLLGEHKVKVVELIRRTQPDVMIMQDPEHAQHDLDPDRRVIAILFAEAMAVAARDWRLDECGGHSPHPIPTVYYMTPENPNCVVEIGGALPHKLKALEELSAQSSFSAEHWLERTTPDVLRQLVPTWTEGDLETLGREGQKTFFTALALSSGLASHSGAVLGEPYRRESTFVLDRLTP
jgi:LmbE family N-acetylglucosaminyl deacetylase